MQEIVGLLMINTNFLSQPPDFIAAYTQQEIKKFKRFKIICFSNPVGWVIGFIFLINKLFKKAVLKVLGPQLFGTNIQRKKIVEQYFPSYKTSMQGVAVRLQRPDGCLIEGMHFEGQKDHINSAQNKTILLFTGSGSPYEFYAVPIVKAYQKQGYDVLCINYAGFGQSQGLPSESSFELDAETAYQYILHTKPGTDIKAHGYSLGSYPATYLAKKHHLNKVVIDRGFSKISNVARDEATKLGGKIIGCILKILVTYVGAMDNIKNVKASSCHFLCGRVSEDPSYHVDLIKHAGQNVTVIDFEGEHFQRFDSTWFENNTQFWEWLSG